MAQTTCEFKDSLVGRPCREAVHPGHPSLCILHDPSSDKDRALFLATLKARVEREEKVQLEEADLATWHVNLGGVVFPPGFRWADVSGGRPLGNGVTFSRATFTGDADFWRARFSADFVGAQFSGNANFAAATFSGGVFFQGATFTGNADFGGATFAGVTAFGGATFTGNAQFGGATFGDTFFQGAHFSGRADFGRARFSAATEFAVAQFTGDANFQGATFTRNATFWGATFSGDADFSEATFEKSLLFVRTRFPQATGANPPGASRPGTVRFNGVTLREPEGVLFQDVDLSRTSFLGTDLRPGTDLRKVRFINVRWAERSEWLRPWPTRRRFRILYDDPRATGAKHADETRYHQAAEMYRQLRLNMEESKQEIEAGDFYIGQMDMRRHDTHSPWFYRAVGLWLYWFAALYGENFSRPICLYLFLGTLFGAAYMLGGFQGVEAPVHRPLWVGPGALLDMGLWEDYKEAWFLALRAGLPFGAEPQFFSRWLSGVRYLNALLNVLLLALVVIALRRLSKR